MFFSFSPDCEREFDVASSWRSTIAKFYDEIGGDEFQIEGSLYIRRCLCDCWRAGRGGLGAIHIV